jgi:RND superfamily putative drug exporter
MSLTVRVARWSATHTWRAIALWTVFVALCFMIGTITGVRESDGEQGFGESGRATEIVESGGFDDPSVENVLITPRDGRLDPAAATAAAGAAKARLSGFPEVASIGDPVTAPEGRAVLVRVELKAEPDDATVTRMLDATAAVQREHPGLRVEQVGGASIGKALNETIGRDFQRAELTSVPVTLLILLVAFGAMIAAAVPVVLALSAVGAAIGLAAIASHLVPAVETTNSMILLIGLAVGIDYSLFYLRREREERAKGRGHVDAVEIAAATSGHAVVVSGIAVIISMAALFLAGDMVFSSLGTGAILVVAVAVVGSLTVLPAVLAKLGRWVDRPRIPLLWRLTAARPGGPRFWPAVLRPAIRRPLLTLILSVGALLLLAAPALSMKLRFPGEGDLPRTTPVMQAYDRLVEAFPSTGTTHLVAVRAPAERAGEVRSALDALITRTSGDPLFAPDTLAKPEVSADGRVAYLPVATPYETGTEGAIDSLTKLRTELVPATVGTVPGAEYAIGGFDAFNEDYAAQMQRKLPLVMAVVLLLTAVVMMVTFRSVVVALTAIVLNLLSAGAAYGLVQLVFGGTWAEDLLGFHSMRAIVAWVPLFLFVVLFGLSMDYHVFVVSRIREAAMRGLPTREAVASGITGSAGVVSSAAVVMVAVFSIFASLSMIEMKQLGVGLAAAILIDATLIRAVVLPSVMILLGRANWWGPRLLRRGAPVPPSTPATPQATAPEPALAHAVPSER